VNTFPVLLAALYVYALAYRYYGAVIAAKALALEDRRTTPRAHARRRTELWLRRLGNLDRSVRQDISREIENTPAHNPLRKQSARREHKK
jgi:hypothetical protein